MAEPVDITGWLRKRKKLQDNIMEVAEKGLQDAASYVLGTLVDEIINGGNPRIRPYVGVITGNLKRSAEIGTAARGRIRIAMNTSIAPYALSVSDWTKQQYGQTYMEITADRTSPVVQRIFTRAMIEGIEAAANDRSFEYRNQFPPTSAT